MLFTGDRYFRARVVFVSSNGGSVRSVSMSRGPDTGMKIEHREVDGDGHKAIGKMVDEKPQLYRRITGSDPAIVLLFLFGLVLLIGLSVSLCYPAQHAPSLAKSQVRDGLYICSWYTVRASDAVQYFNFRFMSAVVSSQLLVSCYCCCHFQSAVAV